MRLLGSLGVLSTDLAARMRTAVGFRDVLVHEFVDVDDAIVVGRVADHEDLGELVVAVATWMDEHQVPRRRHPGGGVVG